MEFLGLLCQIRSVCLYRKHYLTMTSSAVGRSEVCFGEYTRGLNSPERWKSPVAYDLFSHKTSTLRSWGDEPPKKASCVAHLGVIRSRIKYVFSLEGQSGGQTSESGFPGWKAGSAIHYFSGPGPCCGSISPSTERY